MIHCFYKREHQTTIDKQGPSMLEWKSWSLPSCAQKQCQLYRMCCQYRLLPGGKKHEEMIANIHLTWWRLDIDYSHWAILSCYNTENTPKVTAIQRGKQEKSTDTKKHSLNSVEIQLMHNSNQTSTMNKLKFCNFPYSQSKWIPWLKWLKWGRTEQAANPK